MNAKTRDEAVILLNAIGSRQSHRHWAELTFFSIANELDISNEGLSVARAAYDAIPSMHAQCMETGVTVGEPFAHELEALEAACLLESGWEVGDELQWYTGEDVPSTEPFAAEQVDLHTDAN